MSYDIEQLVGLDISVYLHLPKGKWVPALLNTRPVSGMHFAMLHQDSMCNCVRFLVCLLPRVKSSLFSERLKINLTFLILICINIIAVCQSLLSHLGNHDPAPCSHVTSLLIKIVGVMTIWRWGRCSCHSRYPACSAATENCEVKVSPTDSSGTSEFSKG